MRPFASAESRKSDYRFADLKGVTFIVRKLSETASRQRFGGNLGRLKALQPIPGEVGDACDRRVEKSSQFDAHSGNAAGY